MAASDSTVVIGAGLAGLVAAHRIQAAGREVVVVEKARGAGGRMSTRRTGEHRFNHGAQYFTARHPEFCKTVADWEAAGLVEAWPARIAVIDDALAEHDPSEPRYVGVPGMSAICSSLAQGLSDCRFGWRLSEAAIQRGRWVLRSAEGAVIRADSVICTAPPEQAQDLFPIEGVRNALAEVSMAPCWAVMLCADRPVLRAFDAAFVNRGPLSWMARQLRSGGGTDDWVLHASATWSERHLDEEASVVCERLVEAASALPGANAFKVNQVVAHRWRYALARHPLAAGALAIEGARLTLAGDWCHGSRVEGAYLSGLKAATLLMGR